MKIIKLSGTSSEVILSDGSRLLISYETPVAMYCSKNNTYFETDKFWSSTTSKHINRWIDKTNCVEISQDILDAKFNSI